MQSTVPIYTAPTAMRTDSHSWVKSNFWGNNDKRDWCNLQKYKNKLLVITELNEIYGHRYVPRTINGILWKME